uniref:Ovule protein n=1 Tax=Panagrellus redivivus TaxID=6233 RepID=A0A7E4UYJ9_PANRE
MHSETLLLLYFPPCMHFLESATQPSIQPSTVHFLDQLLQLNFQDDQSQPPRQPRSCHFVFCQQPEMSLL